ncbi:hypothetical protein BWQ96_05853 [Gracilariopsis chorda]|uniref:Uncharacterized protein n=1 Tax=Gracilariopsis chorda TaxID=448386 RepID=A0A2V3ITG8_9FLOR|nr:hypothetical protein BWQ96_05853 [Gracilariopsis chorda]|eukprot:PXF44410.1 hypothetical protein BWQ96_05853 [Gracilariopsis chorda]
MPSFFSPRKLLTFLGGTAVKTGSSDFDRAVSSSEFFPAPAEIVFCGGSTPETDTAVGEALLGFGGLVANGSSARLGDLGGTAVANVVEVVDEVVVSSMLESDGGTWFASSIIRKTGRGVTLLPVTTPPPVEVFVAAEPVALEPVDAPDPPPVPPFLSPPPPPEPPPPLAPNPPPPPEPGAPDPKPKPFDPGAVIFDFPSDMSPIAEPPPHEPDVHPDPTAEDPPDTPTPPPDPPNGVPDPPPEPAPPLAPKPPPPPVPGEPVPKPKPLELVAEELALGCAGEDGETGASGAWQNA